MPRAPAKTGKFGKPARPKKFDKALRAEPKSCRFCQDRMKDLDYKDLGTIAKMVTTQGKMFSSKRSTACHAHQRSLETAIKRARFLALIPYTG